MEIIIINNKMRRNCLPHFIFCPKSSYIAWRPSVEANKYQPENYMSLPALSLRENVNLAPYNTLHIPACADYFIEIRSEQELQGLLSGLDCGEKPIFILGGGSNVLFVDDFEGLVVRIAITGKRVDKKTEDHVWLTFGAGEDWHEVVRYCVQKGWGGIENLSLIPGTAGAAPIQNIGAYGVELQDVFASLEAIEIATGEKRSFNKQECEFGYRDSIFKNELKNRYAITGVTLKLSLNPAVNTSYGSIKDELAERGITEPTIANISDVVIDIRNRKLPNPATLANAGSFFKNPVIKNSKYKALKNKYSQMPGYAVGNSYTKVPAGWLIEQAGWKGKISGNAGTYEQQALVIVNRGGATGKEILGLAKKIQKSVRETFNIQLVPEVNIISDDDYN
jgi:UDP-N-acetylmuramate dehydrogenase